MTNLKFFYRLGFKTLADRRFEANLTFLSRFIDGVIDSTELLTQINFKVSTFNAHHMYLYSLLIKNTNYSKNQPLHRMMNIVNKDPSTLLV